MRVIEKVYRRWRPLRTLFQIRDHEARVVLGFLVRRSHHLGFINDASFPGPSLAGSISALARQARSDPRSPTLDGPVSSPTRPCASTPHWQHVVRSRSRPALRSNETTVCDPGHFRSATKSACEASFSPWMGSRPTSSLWTGSEPSRVASLVSGYPQAIAMKRCVRSSLNSCLIFFDCRASSRAWGVGEGCWKCVGRLQAGTCSAEQARKEFHAGCFSAVGLPASR